MEFVPFYETDFFTRIIIPILIFCARTIDVAIGTIRIIFVYKGNKLIAFCLGFLEMLVWIAAIGYVMQNLSKPINIIAFALGFAFGNVVGIYLENKLAVGKLLVRIFATQDTTALVDKIKGKQHGITSIQAHGTVGPIKILYTIIGRKHFPAVAQAIQEFNPKAFYTIEDLRTAKEGVFPIAHTRGGQFLPIIRGLRRK